MTTILISRMSILYYWDRSLTESLVHLHGTLVDDVEESAIFHLTEYLSCVLLTIEEDVVGVVGAYYDETRVESTELDVHIEDVLLRNARDADGRPRFPVLHRGIGIYVIQDHSDVS